MRLTSGCKHDMKARSPVVGIWADSEGQVDRPRVRKCSSLLFALQDLQGRGHFCTVSPELAKTADSAELDIAAALGYGAHSAGLEVHLFVPGSSTADL